MPVAFAFRTRAYAMQVWFAELPPPLVMVTRMVKVLLAPTAPDTAPKSPATVIVVAPATADVTEPYAAEMVATALTPAVRAMAMS